MKNLFTLLSHLRGSMGNLQSSDVSLDRRLTVGSPSGLDAKWKQNPFMRFAVVLTLIFSIGVGNAWGKEYTYKSFTTSFVKGSTNGTYVNTQVKTDGTTKLSTISDSNDCFTTNPTTVSNTYYNSTGVGLRISKSSGAGSIKFTLTDALKDSTIYAIVVYASKVSGNTKATLVVTPTAPTGGYTTTTNIANGTLKAYSGSYGGTNSYYKLDTIKVGGKKINTLQFGSASGGYTHLQVVEIITQTEKAAGCSNNVGVTKGTENHGEVTTIGSASVATCSGTASDRRVTITVTPDDCYDAPSTLTWTKSSGTVSASKQSGPTDNGDGTYSYVYQFAQNDNGAGTFGVTCTAKAAGKTVNFDAGPGVSASSSLTETCDGSGVTLPSVTASGVCKGWTTFAGWATAPVTDSTTTSGVTLYDAGDNFVPSSNGQTLYAVYSKAKGGGGGETKQVELDLTSNTNWQFPAGSSKKVYSTTENSYTSGDYTIKVAGDGNSSNGYYYHSNGYFLIGKSGAYIKLPAFSFTTSKIVVVGNSGASANTKQNIYVGSTAVSTETTSSASTQTYEINSNYQAAGNIYQFQVTSGHNAQVTKIEVYSPASTTYYCSDPNCCTPLGSINGSVNLTTDGCGAGELKATWKMLATTGIASQTLRVYDENLEEVTAKRITGITASTSNQTKTISGLNPCKEYYVTVENVSSGGEYCAPGDPWESDVVTTLGYTLSVTKSNCSITSGSEPARICNNVSVTYAAATGYALPTSITVTNAGVQNSGWTWNSGTGVLTINKANVTGNVTVTITPTCVSPVITADPTDASYYVGDDPTALSVTATLASGTRTYLWKVSTNGGSTWSDATGTNNTFSYSGASLSTASAGTLKFKCIVGNSEGGCSVESGVATITVSNASYFPNGKTIFIQAESTSAWSDANYDCVKAWFHTAGGSETAQSTYWLFNATGGDAGKKLYATVVPATGDLPYLDIQRFTHDCSLWRNKNGGCSYSDANGSNTIRSTGNTDTYDAKDDYIRWNVSGVTIDLYGDPSDDDWASSLASFSDQGAGVWTATYENYAPANAAGESQDFKAKTNYNGWIGNTGSNNNATLDGMHVGSTYDVTATLDIKDHSLEMSKTFVKGTVHFNLQGHGLAISDLTNVTAGSKISAPSAPSATGYTFGGWYKEPACTNAWTFASDEVNETMTLYAKWTANVYTITKTFSNVANAGLPASFTYTGATTTALNSTFAVDATNFFLPNSIAVTMGGTPLTPGTDYTYNNSTGAFTFSAVITGNIVITATATAKLKSIAITTQPTTRAYLAGETFSKTGAVVTATMGDGTTKAVTASATWTPSGTLSAGTSQTVTATYTEAGIEKTATTTINVYSVTVQKYDETPAEITNPGVTASASGRTLLQSVGSTKYVFNNWSLITASGMSISTNSLTGTPTGNVVVRANFYKPVVITWLKGGDEYSTGGPTTEVARGAQWKDLTLPTAPADNSLGACADKFMGWSNTMAEEWVKEDTHTAPATLFTSVTGNTTVINAPITFRAVFATASGGSTTKTWTFSAPGSDLGYGDETSDTQDGLTWKYNAYYSTTASPAMTGIQLNNCNSSRAPSFYIPGYNSYPIESIKISASASVTFNVVSNKPVKSDSQSALASASGTSATIDCSKLSPQIQSCYIKTSGSVQVQEVEVKYSSVSYSDYVTVCCTQYDITLASSGSVTGGTFNAGGTASACEGAEVTLSATPADGYSFAGWTVTKTASPYTDITSTNVAGNTLTMPAYGVTVNASFATLTGIVVKTAPTKTTYCEGDNFDPTGLVITASFSNSTTLDIPYSGNEAKFTFSPTTAASLTTGNTSVTITYSGQSTSQAITVNGKLAVTKTGSGTVTGGTFTVDNATACVGTTINIEAAAASHYTFGSWTITKTSDGTDVTASVSIGSASSATTSFTMPAYGVTVTPTFNEDAYHTATFKNNGAVIDGYDEVKTYDGERPSAPTLTDITDACDKTDCNKFYGWIAEGDIWDETIDDVSAKIIYRTAGDLPNVSGADVVYHAVWAKGTGAPAIPNTLIAKWDKQSIAASTAIKAKDKDGNTLNSVTMTSNIAMTTSAVYGYANSSISTDPVITLAGLDFSDYSAGVITFFARGSQQALVTVEYSTDNGSSYSTDHFSDGTAKKELGYVVTVPNTTTNVKISYGSNTGNFYFGSVRAYGTQTTSYDFTELTSSNTSGWSGADWDGYYLIVGNSNTKAFRSDIMEGLYGMTTVSPSEGVISTSDLGLMFKVKYNSSTTGYAIKSAATQDYLTDDGGGVSEKYHLLETSATEAISIAYNQITHATDYYVQWATDRFGSYGSSTAPTLYKIMSSFTEFRITCCATKVNLTHNSPSNGSIVFGKTKVPTCGDKEVSLTITPATGYQLHSYEVATGSGKVATKSVSPAISLDNNSSAAQNITLTFADEANGAYDVTASFSKMAPTAWAWTYKSEAIPNPINLYVGQTATLNATYTPSGLLNSEQNYNVTKSANLTQTSKTYATPDIHYTFRADATMDDGTVTLTNLINSSLTITVHVHVDPLPLTHFEDLVHGKAFADVVATIEDNALSAAKTTPTSDDWATPNANTCEENHLHLVGWIRKDWPSLVAYLAGTGDAPSTTAIVGAGNDGSGNAYFFSPGASINVQTFNDVTFYAVWAEIK